MGARNNLYLFHMQFNLLLANHGGLDSLEFLAPTIGYLRAALGRCGHEVTITPNEWRRDAVNILLENFPDAPHWAAQIRDARGHGLKVGMVATELFVNGAIPYGNDGIFFSGDEDRAERERYLQARNEGFAAVAGEVDFAWAFLERTAGELGRRCGVSEFLPVGHVGRVPAAERRAPKDIDIAFFGTLTAHRVAVLRDLQKAGLNVVSAGRCVTPGYVPTYGGFVPGYFVESLLDRAKIGLNLTLSAAGPGTAGADPRFASCMRVVEMLERDVCVVSEEIPLDNPYRDYMISAGLEQLADTCRRLLDSGTWRERGERMAGRFRSEMDVSRVCAPVFTRTLEALGVGK